ncbi:Hypothetical protein A7982_00764 [Minicystis rosea]|nr:Hypothetical protein A7982_00764 [Minicystis rosea]
MWKRSAGSFLRAKPEIAPCGGPQSDRDDHARDGAAGTPALHGCLGRRGIEHTGAAHRA